MSEEILYRAVVQVAEAQSRGPRPEDNYGMGGGGGGGNRGGAMGGRGGYHDYDDGSGGGGYVVELGRFSPAEYQLPLRRALMAIRGADGVVQVKRWRGCGPAWMCMCLTHTGSGNPLTQLPTQNSSSFSAYLRPCFSPWVSPSPTAAAELRPVVDGLRDARGGKTEAP